MRGPCGSRVVSGVVLAAGRSRRFAGPLPKQLREFEGIPLVRRAAEAALSADLDQVVVVVGYRAAEVSAALEGLPIQIVRNPHWAEGQSTSVRRGLAALQASSDAALFIPCDQPLLTGEVLDHLVGAYRRSTYPVVVPTFRGRRGAPTLLARILFPQLERLTGDEGGRQILQEHEDETLFVALSSGEALRDVDREEDLETLSEKPSAPAPIPGLFH